MISDWHKMSKVAHIAQVTCFENIVRTRRLINPNFFLTDM